MNTTASSVSASLHVWLQPYFQVDKSSHYRKIVREAGTKLTCDWSQDQYGDNWFGVMGKDIGYPRGVRKILGNRSPLGNSEGFRGFLGGWVRSLEVILWSDNKKTSTIKLWHTGGKTTLRSSRWTSKIWGFESNHTFISCQFQVDLCHLQKWTYSICEPIENVYWYTYL